MLTKIAAKSRDWPDLRESTDKWFLDTENLNFLGRFRSYRWLRSLYTGFVNLSKLSMILVCVLHGVLENAALENTFYRHGTQCPSIPTRNDIPRSPPRGSRPCS